MLVVFFLYMQLSPAFYLSPSLTVVSSSKCIKLLFSCLVWTLDAFICVHAGGVRLKMNNSAGKYAPCDGGHERQISSLTQSKGF